MPLNAAVNACLGPGASCTLYPPLGGADHHKYHVLVFLKFLWEIVYVYPEDIFNDF